jgi:hypothetical protein
VVEGDKIVVEFKGKGGKQIKQELRIVLLLEWYGLSRHSEDVGCSMRRSRPTTTVTCSTYVRAFWQSHAASMLDRLSALAF